MDIGLWFIFYLLHSVLYFTHKTGLLRDQHIDVKRAAAVSLPTHSFHTLGYRMLKHRTNAKNFSSQKNIYYEKLHVINGTQQSVLFLNICAVSFIHNV